MAYNLNKTEADFWLKVAVGLPEECWPWLGFCTRDGYGRWDMKTRRQGTHRWAYEFSKGPIASGLFVLHSCDNKPCCNPSHLREGTPKENTADAIKRKRMKLNYHLKCPQTKLTAEQVGNIREDRATGMLLKPLGIKYGVSFSCIWNILVGKTWKHVPKSEDS